ncbi:MAG: DUF362 domain-containing protein [Opitutales bacterium]|nr:DUF362 domain-containing protein [Opitutales bacterium]MCH8540971.1 DUF362 domain-containing protein [Opitutales bacterium]
MTIIKQKSKVKGTLRARGKTFFGLLGVLLFPLASVLQSQVGFFEREKLESFDLTGYQMTVKAGFEQWEKVRGEPLVPGEQGRVALKIDTASGAGLSTSKDLVRAVRDQLEERGWERTNIWIVDLREHSLRSAGYWPARAAGGKDFEGSPVFALEGGDFWESDWFYENPLPSRRAMVDRAHSMVARGETNFVAEGEDRFSYLPVPMFFDVDFWINLPVVTDHSHLFLNGAMVNATLWNASNTNRFLRSRSNGPAAVANIAAIPELRESWAMTILSMERFQFIGGPEFRSLYTTGLPEVIFSTDPVAVDYYALGRLNQARQQAGFRPLPTNIPYLRYAEYLGIGYRERAKFGNEP